MRAVLLFALLLCFGWSCRKVDPIDNLNNGEVLIIGHGGSGFEDINNPYPANSWTSIIRALEGMALDGVEVDVQLDADDKLWLFHDAILDGDTDCFGCIGDQSSSTLATCTYREGSTTPAVRKHKIIPLDSLLNYVHENGIKTTLYLDALTTDRCRNEDDLADAMHTAIDRYNAADWVYVISGSSKLLERMQAQNSAYRLFLDRNADLESVQLAREEGFSGISSALGGLTEEGIDAAHEAGLQVITFGVKARSNVLQATAMHVDGIISDNIEVTLAALR